MSSAGILLEIAVKTSIVFSLAWVVTHLVAKRWAAAARHVIWALAMAAALGIPILVNIGPTWEIAAVPGTWAASVRSALGASGSRHGDSDVWPSTASVSSHAPMVAEQRQREQAPNLVTAPQPSGAGEATWWFAFPTLVAITWTVGACTALISLIVGLLCTSWFARRAAPLLTPDWTALQADTAARVGVTARVRLSVSSHVGAPVACGLFRHTILLPVDADSWDQERRTVVLLHELAHVKRHDCLIQAMALLAWVFHWYNPLVLLAQSQLRAEQERACDDMVLNAGTPAVAYADHLCEIASQARRTLVPVWSTLSIARPSRLAGRVTAILDETRRRQPPSWRFYAAALGLVILGVGPLAAAHESMARQAMASLPLSPVATLSSYTTLMPALHSRDVSTNTADLVASTGSGAFAAAPAAGRPSPQELTTESSRFILDGCMACHNRRMHVANLAFEELDVEHPARDVDIWENVIRRLRTNLHPPAGVPRPSRAAAEAFAASLEAALDRADQVNWLPGRAEPIGNSELATRLAAFLWSAAPDDTLRTVAASGGLHDPVKLEQQVRRMLLDKRADAFLTGFFGSWLHIKNLSTVKMNPEQFPDFGSFREAFQQETALFLASQVRGDRALPELLNANYTFLNDRLAEHYGIAGVTGSQFRKVTLPNDERAGLLGHGSILTITSYDGRTSPVVRGKWVLETWLGLLAPAPPPNIPALKPRDPEHLATMRARMEQHRKNPACASCHTTMDGFGFALENFDAIGRWRMTEDGLAIDTSGTLPDGSRFDGPSQLRSLLLDRRDAIISTVALKLLAYSLGRPARFSDMPAVRAIVWDASSKNYSWTSTIAAIVRSAPFRMKQIE